MLVEHHGNLPKIQAALKSWLSPSTTATVANQTLRWSESLKKRRK